MNWLAHLTWSQSLALALLLILLSAAGYLIEVRVKRWKARRRRSMLRRLNRPGFRCVTDSYYRAGKLQ